MFFILSKLLWVVAAPTNLLLALTAAGMLAALRGRRWGRRLAAVALAALILCGVLPVGRLMLLPLEDRFAAPAPDAAAPDGIIVLGGAVDQVIGAGRGQVTLVEGASRMTAGVALARQFPEAKLVFTGGSSAFVLGGGTEAAEAGRLWRDLGVDPARIVLEDRSRNTDENARLTRDLLRPAPGQRWWLVTSAFHMPRSVGLFRAAGLDVVPYPVDYRSSGTWRDLMPTGEVSAGLRRLDLAAREWIGLVAYRMSGKTAAVLPAP